MKVRLTLKPPRSKRLHAPCLRSIKSILKVKTYWIKKLLVLELLFCVFVISEICLD